MLGLRILRALAAPHVKRLQIINFVRYCSLFAISEKWAVKVYYSLLHDLTGLGALLVRMWRHFQDLVHTTEARRQRRTQRRGCCTIVLVFMSRRASDENRTQREALSVWQTHRHTHTRRAGEPRAFLSSKKDFNDFNWAPMKTWHTGARSQSAGGGWMSKERAIRCTQCAPVNERICRDAHSLGHERRRVDDALPRAISPRRCGPRSDDDTATAAAAAAQLSFSACLFVIAATLTASWLPRRSDI